MKRILIAGADSYIGTSFEKRALEEPENYSLYTVDMRENSWRQTDFSDYDVVLYVAGIAHIKETKNNAGLYYEVNRDMAIETAKKAKSSGVKQFIFLSSMSVYGKYTGVITNITEPDPVTNYGRSKLEAEQGLLKLMDDNFSVALLRPPMVYGKDCRGNYQTLRKLALKCPCFPDINNKRSMIYIDNLTEFIKYLVDDRKSGLFFPQNADYVTTSEMVSLIAKSHGKRIHLTRLFNPLLKILKINVVKKAFCDLVYDMSMSECKVDYRVCNLDESISMTEANV